jgi:hypothetical protein
MHFEINVMVSTEISHGICIIAKFNRKIKLYNERQKAKIEKSKEIMNFLFT